MNQKKFSILQVNSSKEVEKECINRTLLLSDGKGDDGGMVPREEILPPRFQHPILSLRQMHEPSLLQTLLRLIYKKNLPQSKEKMHSEETFVRERKIRGFMPDEEPKR